MVGQLFGKKNPTEEGENNEDVVPTAPENNEDVVEEPNSGTESAQEDPPIVPKPETCSVCKTGQLDRNNRCMACGTRF